MVGAIFLKQLSDGAINKTDNRVACKGGALPRWWVCSSHSIYLNMADTDSR